MNVKLFGEDKDIQILKYCEPYNGKETAAE